MSDDYDERQWFFDRRADKTIISKRITNTLSGRNLRIASHIVESEAGLRFATIKDEIVLRQTPAGRWEIKATFLEDDRSIKTLTIQKFNSRSGPSDRQYFSFVGNEITALMSFVAGIKSVPPLEGKGKLHLPDDILREVVLDYGEARRIFAKNSEIFLTLAQHEEITRDLIAVGYRRNQLRHFEALLRDSDYFDAEQKERGCRPEDVWQAFFEANTWIFGYGLSYQFVSKLDQGKLEQIVRGVDITSAGKRSDALMKTRGLISSLCFVEIKRHDTRLLGPLYRSDAWAPSAELAGGVSQVQATVQAAIEAFGNKLTPTDEIGNPTGEVLFNIEPRSCLIVGALEEFRTDQGINVPKFRSFELYRRHTWRPEIITFDELLERARFIVDHGGGASPENVESDTL